jgi:nitrogenase subunit NifH
LNERQKEKLVEAVSKANSIKEAKVIYETLQKSLDSKSQNAPKNLNEAVSKNNRLVLKSNNKETQVSNAATERMKKLAGII